METSNIIIRPFSNAEEIPYDLLLLSDDTKEAIDKNLDKGELYLGLQGDKIIAAFILKIIQQDTVEIKNIAVSEDYQGKGIGTKLLDFIKKNVKQRGFHILLVGTCDQCQKEIEFYKKSDFTVIGIHKNFFLDNYKEAIFENGKQIIDMIILKKDL